MTTDDIDQQLYRDVRSCYRKIRTRFTPDSPLRPGFEWTLSHDAYKSLCDMGNHEANRFDPLHNTMYDRPIHITDTDIVPVSISDGTETCYCREPQISIHVDKMVAL